LDAAGHCCAKRQDQVDASIKGVYPPLVTGALASAPASNSTRVDLILAFCAAMASGVKPPLSVASSFAPCAISISTNIGLSPHVAHMRGVQPLRSRRFASALCSIKYVAPSTEPERIAVINGV